MQAIMSRQGGHGLSKHKFYPIWRDMMNRCYSKNNRFFGDYGGRGIFVCSEWHNVASFINWCSCQEPIPRGYSLDRYPDKDGPYSPDNCRFASPAQQNRNMRSNVWVEFGGRRMIFKDFVEEYGVVSYDVAKKRVRLHGFDLIGAALTAPFARPRPKKKRCKHGHLFSSSNTYIHLGQRYCRKCRASSAQKHRENSK